MEKVTFCIPLELSLEVATLLQLCEAINTPRALAVSLLVEAGEWQQYLELPIHYDMLDVRNFADDYLVSVMLRKSPNLPLAVDRAAVAKQGFYENEANCKATNSRFKSRGLYHKHLLTVRREVARILGPLTDNDLRNVERSFGFGPGANVGVKGLGMVLSDKYDNNITLTRSLYPFYRTILGDLWWEHQRRPDIVKGNRFTTVPKDAKKDRGICVEPLLNTYVQKGIGAVIRNRLASFGIDLNVQSEVNSDLASKAYRCQLATIDLEAASDSVSLEVVRELLPPRWFELLSLARCNFTLIDGEYVELEKFSSMGNAYTFELESLLFWAIVRAVVPSSEHTMCSVFGDDIIVPQAHASELVDTLNFFGFKVNASKSFLAGSFFESCGTDWFLGTNVRPFFLKGSTNEKVPYALQIANKLRIYSRMRGYGLGCDDRFLPCWRYLRSRVPKPWRNCIVPVHFGDVGLIADRSEVKEHRRCKNGIEGGRIRCVQVEPKKIRKDTLGRHLIALRNAGTGSAMVPPDIWRKLPRALRYELRSRISDNDLGWTLGWEPRRGFLRRPVTKWTYYHSWSEGLLWTTIG